MRTLPSSAVPSLLFAFASVGAIACSSSAAPGPVGPVDPTPLPGVSVAQSSAARAPVVTASIGPVVTANNAFALSLYGNVAAGSTGNVMTSPLSATLALTMTYAGAKGETATEIATALQLPADTGSVFAGENALTQALAGRAAAALAADQQRASENNGAAPLPADYAFDVVNSVWGQKAFPWVPAFLDVLAEDYGTGVYQEDFAGNAAPPRRARSIRG